MRSLVIVQTKIEDRKSIARVRCWTCLSDYFEVIETGKNKEFQCDECKALCEKVEMEQC